MRLIPPEGASSFSAGNGEEVKVQGGVAVEVESPALAKVLMESHGYVEAKNEDKLKPAAPQVRKPEEKKPVDKKTEDKE